MGKRYSPQLKFQVVMEVLTGDKSAAQVARAYNIHPNTVGAWKREFLEKGPELFGQKGMVREYEKRIAELEQLLGKKEVEIALLVRLVSYGYEGQPQAMTAVCLQDTTEPTSRFWSQSGRQWTRSEKLSEAPRAM